MTDRRRSRVLVAAFLVVLTSCTAQQRQAWCRAHPTVGLGCVPATTTSTTVVATTTTIATTTAATVAGTAGGGAAPEAATTTTTTTSTTTTVPPVVRATVVALGDSQTWGNALPNQTYTWPSQLALLSAGTVQVTNQAVGGITLASATTPRPYGDSIQERFDAGLAHHPDVLVVLGGTNDFAWGVVTVQEVKDALSDMASRAHTAGVRLVLCTIPPFGRQSPDWVARNPERDAVNDWMRTNIPDVVDVDAHVSDHGVLPDSQQVAQLDGVHLGPAAERWIAEQVLALID